MRKGLTQAGWLDAVTPDFCQESLRSPRLGAGLSLVLGKAVEGPGSRMQVGGAPPFPSAPAPHLHGLPETQLGSDPQHTLMRRPH